MNPTNNYICLEMAIADYDIEKYIKNHSDAIPCRFCFTGDSLFNWWDCDISISGMYDIAEFQCHDTDTQYVLDNNPALYKALDTAIKNTPFSLIEWEPYELEPCVLNDKNWKVCVGGDSLSQTAINDHYSGYIEAVMQLRIFSRATASFFYLYKRFQPKEDK